MAEVGFADLVELYRHIRFDGAGTGVRTVASQRIADTLRAIEADQALYDETQISLVVAGDPAVGEQVHVNVGPPRLSLGILAANFASLFRAPGAAFREPPAYYVVESGYASGDEPVPETLRQYRAAIRLIGMLRSAASYVDERQRELVFISDRKVVIPIALEPADLARIPDAQVERLADLLHGDLHADERHDLLASAVVEIAAGQRRVERFAFLLANLEQVSDEVEKGYRLFVSSFSYSKIRKEIETARLDYIGRIHKTFTDIQGQLLGIPIATIVVAAQLKRTTGCDVAFWGNLAILLGAWIFLALLSLAIRNQWHTLSALDREIRGQRERLERDHAAVRDDLIDVFDDLTRRLRSNRRILFGVASLALAGAILATTAFLMLTARGSLACLIGG